MDSEVINDLASKYNKDKRVIKLICEHPLLFAKQRIEDPNDIRAVMIRYLCKFVPKHNKTIEDKKINYNKFLSRKAIALERLKSKITSNNNNNITLS